VTDAEDTEQADHQQRAPVDGAGEESPDVSANALSHDIQASPVLSLVGTSEQAQDRPLDEDRALVRAAKAGDRSAFSKLFEKHNGRVYAMCTRFLRNTAEIEDAVQQTFLEAYKSLHRFEERSKFTTWVTRIAIHTCLGFRRKLKRLFFSEDTLPDDRVEQAHFSNRPLNAEESALYRRRRQAVSDLLAKVSEKKRVVFVLAELEGMTAPEISEVLEVPDATVRTRLFHARKEFAQLARAHPEFIEFYD
jgi:RNA polymerase sigma-70 factor (ECF subfamily)